jgi:MFS transporter, DHA1 family, tetracycline resistance protein
MRWAGDCYDTPLAGSAAGGSPTATADVARQRETLMTLPNSPTVRHAAFAFVFVTVVLDMLALGLIIPVLPKLIESFMGGNTARAATVYGVFATAWALMQFLFSPVLGSLSDRLGRRPVILFSNFGLGLDYVFMALAPGVGWLFVGRVISGIASASVSTASAYIADVTPPEQRAAKFGLLGAAFGFGFVVGPALGGVLGNVDPRLPFWFAAALSLTNALYGLLVLPESLPRERRSAFSWRKANPLGALQLLRSHQQLWSLASVTLISNLAHVALPSLAVLYMGYRYGWDARAVGLMLAAVGVCTIIVQGILVRPAVRVLGEWRTLILGLLCGATGFVLQGIAESWVLYLAGIVVMSMWGLMNPALQSLQTQLVDPGQQGRLQGANSSMMGIANMVGPILFTQLFAVAINQWGLPGAPFLLSASLLTIASLVALKALRQRAGYAGTAVSPG